MARICPRCNYAGNTNDTECIQCGTPLAQDETVGAQNGHNTGQSREAAETGGPEARRPSRSPTQRDSLAGRITWMENTSENIDFNRYRFFSQLIILILFLPVILSIFLVSTALWISLGMLGFRTIAQGLSPFNLINAFNSFGIFFAIGFPRVPQRNQVPVVRMTVDTDGAERTAMVKGELISGTFRRGDEVELIGHWRAGTLIALRGTNRTLGTDISIRRDYWNIVFYILIVLLAVLFSIGVVSIS